MKLGEDFLQRFLTECTRDARRCIAKLQTSATGLRWGEFRDACHPLNVAAGNMGAVRLVASADDAMHSDSARLQRDWPTLVPRMLEQLEQALAALASQGDLTVPGAGVDRS